MGGSDDDTELATELTVDDRAALVWALSINHEVGAPAVRRVRSGGGGLTRRELLVVHRDWETAGRPPPEPPHRHRTPVHFPDGSIVVGVTFVDDDPYARDTPPEFGVYLDRRWSPPWPHRHIDWPDFGVPTDAGDLRSALVDLAARARQGERVEIGCWGGHGRTGTALACLAVLAGVPSADAVGWVRDAYCRGAIETPEQERLVATFT